MFLEVLYSSEEFLTYLRNLSNDVRIPTSRNLLASIFEVSEWPGISDEVAEARKVNPGFDLQRLHDPHLHERSKREDH
jgi:hypothetical protein